MYLVILRNTVVMNEYMHNTLVNNTYSVILVLDKK